VIHCDKLYQISAKLNLLGFILPNDKMIADELTTSFFLSVSSCL